VNGNGAYEDEMNEVSLFESALRAAVPTEPDPRLGVLLVPRLAEAARASTIEAETHAVRRRPRSRRALVARVGIAVALVPLVLAGLAFAGVTVPQPARSVFNAVGITLPNQPSKTSNQSKNAVTPQSSHPSAEGTGTSQSQSTGNSEAAHRHALEQHAKAKGKAIGHTRGRAIGLNELVPPGHSGQTGPPAHSNAGGNGNGSANGQTKTPPSNTKTSPGHTKTSPGHTKTPPGHTKTPPGHTK
jgi:hypothetical protein